MTVRWALALSIALAAAGAPIAAQEPAAFDRAAIVKASSVKGFDAAEEEALAAASAGETNAVIALAQFYMAHDLWVEALAALKRLEAGEAPQAIPLAAECDYRLGRYARALQRLEATPQREALEAMALSRLGAYADAAAIFAKSPPLPATRLRTEYFLAKAEALVEVRDADGALDALAVAGDAGNVARRRYIFGVVNAAHGNQLRARAEFRAAARDDVDDWSMRARLALAAATGDVAALNALRLKWRGGAFERELHLSLGELLIADADYDKGLPALRLVYDRFPLSDDAVEAGDAIAAALPALFAAQSDLHPKEAAQIFFENVEFAPPGRDGDTLIQEAARKLQSLGLNAQAATLVDHQVFKRLRGAERARVAADLADIHLQTNDAAEALRVIRSTRFEGLPRDLVQRRRLIEAQALAAIDQTDEALLLLADDPGVEDLRLRADINWSRKSWTEAARDYASSIAASASLNAPEDRTAAVRAAAAFLLAGDRAGYRAFAKEAILRLEGTPEAKLIATLGDVDREQFLANFMSAYRAVYSGEGS
jgi:hypothetical protein